MPALTVSELADLKIVQTAHMMDTWVYVRRMTAPNAYGGETETWVDGNTLPCGFSFSPSASRELLRSTDVPETTHKLRLPHGTPVGEHDRIRITKRFGVVEARPITYEIIGPSHSGPSGVIVNLERTAE